MNHRNYANNSPLASLSQDNYYCPAGIATSDNTPTTWFSVMLPPQACVKMLVRFTCRSSDYQQSLSGDIRGAFLRGGGDIAIQGSPSSDLFSGIKGQQPSISLVPNVAAQAIDVVVAGLKATNMLWHGYFCLVFSL